MNKKGFTLVELLAVIAILAIIAIVIVPKVMDTIKESEQNTAIVSARSFVDAVEQKIVRSDLPTTPASQKINNGDHYTTVAALTAKGVKFDGEAPTAIDITITNNKVAAGAKITINGYEVHYDGSNYTI